MTVIGLPLWTAGTILMARWLAQWRLPGRWARSLPWMAWVPPGVATGWGLVGVEFLIQWTRRGRRSPLARTWLGLAGAAGLAMAVTAAQLLPVVEFTRQTVRAAADGLHDLYPFSLEPFRLVELAFPDVLGVTFGGNTYWRDVLDIPGFRREIWMPSLYLGGLTLVLGCGAWAVRRGPPWRIWLSAIVVVSLVGSLGQYAGPI